MKCITFNEGKQSEGIAITYPGEGQTPYVDVRSKFTVSVHATLAPDLVQVLVVPGREKLFQDTATLLKRCAVEERDSIWLTAETADDANDLLVLISDNCLELFKGVAAIDLQPSATDCKVWGQTKLSPTIFDSLALTNVVCDSAAALVQLSPGGSFTMRKRLTRRRMFGREEKSETVTTLSLDASGSLNVVRAIAPV